MNIVVKGKVTVILMVILWLPKQNVTKYITFFYFLRKKNTLLEGSCRMLRFYLKSFLGISENIQQSDRLDFPASVVGDVHFSGITSRCGFSWSQRFLNSFKVILS